MLESLFEKLKNLAQSLFTSLLSTRLIETALTKQNLVKYGPLPQQDTHNEDDGEKGGSADSSPGCELSLMALTDEAENIGL